MNTKYLRHEQPVDIA